MVFMCLRTEEEAEAEEEEEGPLLTMYEQLPWTSQTGETCSDVPNSIQAEKKYVRGKSVKDKDSINVLVLNFC